jgi:release factor glutamine methyltransferase
LHGFNDSINRTGAKMAVQETWTTLKILAWTKDYLLSKGVANARLEAEWLLCAVTGLDRVGLYLQYDKPLNDRELAEYRAMVTRRARREPLQHILGSQEFCGDEYEVNADVLIPRHDTEVLVSEAITRQPDARSVLDIGTGSGCIAISLQKRLSKAAVTATDISEAALTVARRNAEKHGATIEFLAGSLFAPVAGRRFDLIVSNPPYIPSADIESLDQEVRDYDPRAALDGGGDGLDIYRALIPAAALHLNPGGWLLVEIGIGQAKEVVQLFQHTCSYGEPLIALDSSGIERAAAAQRKEIL